MISYSIEKDSYASTLAPFILKQLLVVYMHRPSVLKAFGVIIKTVEDEE